MSIESTGHGQEFASPRSTVDRALDRLGIEAVEALDPRTKAQIAFDFHTDRAERDLRDWLPELGLDREQTEAVFGLLCARGGEMLDLLSKLVGYNGDYNFGRGDKYLKQ